MISTAIPAALMSAMMVQPMVSTNSSPAAFSPAFTRRDGRSPSQLRPVSYEQSLLQAADGSVRYTQGNSTLLIAVYGPTLASAREERPDRAVLTFTFASLSSSASLSTSHASLAYHLRETFEPVVLTSLHPRQRIAVHVQVLHDDGALLACAINGAMIALMDAGVQCREVVAAVEMRVRRDDTQAGKESLLLDPTGEESRTFPDGLTLAFPNHSRGVVLSLSDGCVSESAYLAALDTGKRAASHMTHFMRQSISKQLSAGS